MLTRIRNLPGMPSRPELIRLVPAAGLLTVWIVLMPRYGGYFPAAWMPAGLVLVGLLGLAGAVAGRVLPAAPHVRRVLLAFAAFTAFNFLSILWSDAPGKAWDAANLLLVCLIAAWILALTPWRPSTAVVLIGTFCLAAALVCLGELVGALDERDLTSSFEDYRWQRPLGYPNTTAAFAAMAGLPALVAAAAPTLPLAVRALAQGLASFLMTYALLPLSRGSILGILLAGAILLLAVPWRWRLVVHAAALAAVLLAVQGPIVDVYDAASGNGQASDELEGALGALGVATAAGLALGLLLALGQRRIELGDRGRRAARVGGVAAIAAVALGLGVVAIAHSQAIGDEVHDQWEALSHPGSKYGGDDLGESGSERFTSIDPLERYDYWRVSMDGFRDNPLGGMGAGGFEHRYTIDHRYPKLSRYPHNLTMKVLGDTGLIGFGLILAFTGLLVAALLRSRRALSPAQAALTAAALGVAAYFFAHAQFDWLETYPLLAGPALGFLIVALVARAPAAAAPPGGWLRTVAGLNALGVALVSLALPYLAIRYTDRASDVARARPAQAFRDLERAADVNPLGIDALLQRGALGLEENELDIARDSFERANDREDTWLGHFGLGVIAAAEGDRLGAAAALARAQELNRGSPTLRDVVAEVLRSDDVDPVEFFRTAQDTGLFRQKPVR